MLSRVWFSIDLMKNFFVDDNIYSVSTSKYTHAVSTRISRVTGSGTLSIVSDKHSLEKLEEQYVNLMG